MPVTLQEMISELQNAGKSFGLKIIAAKTKIGIHRFRLRQHTERSDTVHQEQLESFSQDSPLSQLK